MISPKKKEKKKKKKKKKKKTKKKENKRSSALITIVNINLITKRYLLDPYWIIPAPAVAFIAINITQKNQYNQPNCITRPRTNASLAYVAK